MRTQEPTEADARSLLEKLAAFAEGLEPGERAVLFDSLPRSSGGEEVQGEVRGHYYSGSDVIGGRPGAPGGELGLGRGIGGKKYYIVVTYPGY
jgi:hypothetical protein